MTQHNPSLEELIDNILQAIPLVDEPLEVLGGRVWYHFWG